MLSYDLTKYKQNSFGKLSNVSLPHTHTSLVLEKYDKIIMLKIPHFSHFTFSSIVDSAFKLDKKKLHIAYSQQLTQSLFYIAIGNLESMAIKPFLPWEIQGYVPTRLWSHLYQPVNTFLVLCMFLLRLLY